MEAAAAKVLGPRPGIMICKFWQGVVEIVLRISTIVICVAAIIASSIALNHVQGLPSTVLLVFSNRVEDLTSLNYAGIIFNSMVAAGLGIAVSCLVIVYEILLVILRFVNIGLVNYKIKIFLSIDVIISFVLAAGFGIAGVLAAYLAVQWSELNDNAEEFMGSGLTPDNLETSRNVLAATAGTTLVGALLVSLLMTWIVLFLIKNWNKKVVKETVKAAF